MRFWNYKSEQFYNMYSQIFDSNFSIEKKKVVLKALFSGEYSLMRITSISKLCYEEYKKNNLLNLRGQIKSLLGINLLHLMKL